MPEVVLRDRSKPRTLAVLIDEMTRREFELVMKNDRLVIFRKPVDDIETAFVYGAGWNFSADFRITCFLYERPAGLQIVAEIEIVENFVFSIEGGFLGRRQVVAGFGAKF